LAFRALPVGDRTEGCDIKTDASSIRASSTKGNPNRKEGEEDSESKHAYEYSGDGGRRSLKRRGKSTGGAGVEEAGPLSNFGRHNIAPSFVGRVDTELKSWAPAPSSQTLKCYPVSGERQESGDPSGSPWERQAQRTGTSSKLSVSARR